MESLIKIVYQNTEFSPKESTFLGLTFAQIISAVIPIALFFAGYYAKGVEEKRKERKRLIELEDYLRKLIELLESPLTKQKDALLKFSHTLKENRERPLNLTIVSGLLNDNQIKEIDKKDLYTIFIKRKNAETDFKTELYNTLKNSLDYIDYIKNSLHGEFNALNELHGKLMEDYKLNIKEIGDIFHEMIATNERDKIELKDDQFLIDFYKIKINWSKLNLHGVSYTDIYVSKKNFIEPMIKLCKTAEADFRAVKILKHAMECIYAFNDLIELKRTYRGIFIMNARGLQESMFRIKRTMLRFNSM